MTIEGALKFITDALPNSVVDVPPTEVVGTPII